MAVDLAALSSKLIGWASFDSGISNAHTPGVNTPIFINGYGATTGVVGNAVIRASRFHDTIAFTGMTSSVSFAFWAKLSAADRIAECLNTITLTSGNKYRLFMSGADLVFQNYFSFNFQGSHLVKSGYSTVCTEWHHIAFHYNSVATRTIKTWFDGVPVAASTPATGDLISGYTSLRHGDMGSSPPSSSFDEATWSGESWTDDEIAWMYNGGAGRIYADIYAVGVLTSRRRQSFGGFGL